MTMISSINISFKSNTNTYWDKNMVIINVIYIATGVAGGKGEGKFPNSGLHLKCRRCFEKILSRNQTICLESAKFFS